MRPGGSPVPKRMASGLQRLVVVGLVGIGAAVHVSPGAALIREEVGAERGRELGGGQETEFEQGPDTTAASDEPSRAAAPQVPSDRAELDRRAEEGLNALFGRIPGLDQVRARVEAGVVVLGGRVLSQEDRALADSLARRMPEVLFVENRIETVTSLRSRLGAALASGRARLLDFVAHLPLLAVAGLIVVLFGFLARWAGRKDRFYARVTSNPFAQNVLRQTVRGGLILLGVLLALQLLEVTALVGAVLGAAGIFGLAVGFAFRAIAENYLAGVFLSLRQPFAPNDHVVLEGEEGKVVRLSARDTVLMTLDGNHLRIPNARVFGAVILNYTRNPLRRFDVPVSVGDAVDLARAQAEGGSALSDMEGVMDEPAPTVRVRELGDGVVLLRFFGWVDQRRHDFGKVRSEAIRHVKARLDRAGIEMPPTSYLVQMAGTAAQDAAADEAAAGPARGRATGPAIREEGIGAAEVGDLSVDRSLDEQIEDDRRDSDETDLLDPDGATAGNS